MSDSNTPPPPDHDNGRDKSPRSRSGSPRRSRSRSPQPQQQQRESRSSRSSQVPNIYVSGLSSRAKEPELEALFNKYGKVDSVKLIRDPRSGDCRGFGFVRMSSEEEVDLCVRKLDGVELDGRRVTTEKARREKSRSPTPGKYLGRSRREPSSRGGSSYYGGGGGGYGYPVPYGYGRPPSYYGSYRYSPYRDGRGSDRSRSPYYERRRSRSPGDYSYSRRERSPYFDESRESRGSRESRDYRASPPRGGRSRSPPRR